MTSLNGVRRGAEAHCERNLNRQLIEVLNEKYCIAVQGSFRVGIIIKAGGLR